MRKQIAGVMLAVLLCLAADKPDAPKHLADAQTLVENISPGHNEYRHKECFIKWKGVDGATRYENRSDCSDFLALLVQHAYGVSGEQLKDWTGHQRPYASHWHDAIVAGSGFTQIIKLADAKPGDVLAVKFPPGLDDTGHVMLMADAAQGIEQKEPIAAGTRQWNVAVIDSTKSPHSDDTRAAKDGGTAGQGVGRGVIRIYTDSAGAIAGYCWSDGSKAAFRAQSERNMVIGRLNVAK
jgi:hypothetical protein